MAVSRGNYQNGDYLIHFQWRDVKTKSKWRLQTFHTTGENEVYKTEYENLQT